MSEYEFTIQFQQGQSGEDVLDRHFRRWFEIRHATQAEQRHGIDRHYISKENGDHFAVEIKTDWTAGKTNNAFIETVSVDTTGKRGWAHTSRADWLLYFIPPLGIVYMLKMITLRMQIGRWKAKYESRAIPNTAGYRTHGILVPLHEFEKYAFQIVTIDAS